MEEVYDLFRHTYCACIFINNDTAYINVFNILLPLCRDDIVSLKKKATITYNKQRTKVLSWGNASIKNMLKEDDIQVNNFMDGLYHVFTKDKKNECLTKAVSDFLSLAIKELMKDKKMKNVSLDSLFYTFLVPSEWEEEIKEDLIRPIFIGANLISKEDHKDRLLFVSDIESICYNKSELFEINQNTVMCRLIAVNPETVLIKLDLINTTNRLFDIPYSLLFPKVIRSNSFFITSDDIKNCIEAILKDKLFPDSEGCDKETTMEIIKECMYRNKNSLKYRSISDNYIYSDVILKELLSTDIMDSELSNLQKTLLKPIFPFDICEVAGKILLGKMIDILSNQFVKKYKFLVVVDEYSSLERYSDSSLNMWLVYMLEYNRHILNDITFLDKIPSKFTPTFYYDDIIDGVKALAQEAIGNSNMHCPPRILSIVNQTVSSSVFINSKPNAIINIDISFKSTLLSYYLLNNDGSVKEIFDHNYLTADLCLPSLEQFYNVSGKVTLKVQEEFFLFVDKYLLDNFNTHSVNKEFLYKIEEIWYKNRSTKENLVCSYKRKYIKAFLLMYLICIKKVISTALSKKLSFMKLKIGYVVSIEKIVLDSIMGTKEDLEELIYKSGLIEKNDEYKKLRIITSGEGVLSIIQQSFNLEFPVKSYFVLAQLHEDYIQLTLNQVVTASSLEDKQQEAIIIEDKIISIPNIYDSLCFNLWNNLIQDNSLIQLCNLHSRSNDEYRMFELFSLETKKEFMSSLKKYISENVLAASANLQNLNKNSIKLDHFCGCKVYLTINDFVEILLKPLLKDINCIMLTSLTNKKLFGHYTNINYHFSLIHFNYNPQLEDIIKTIMKEEAIYFNPKRGIDTLCMVIPKLPSQLFQSLLPFLYKGFQNGTLYQVHDRGYAFKIYTKEEEYKIVDTFPLIKREDKIGCLDINETFYTKSKEFYVEFLKDTDKHKTSDYLKDNPISIQEINWVRMDFLIINNGFSDGKVFIITATPLGHSSTIQFSVRKAGQDFHILYLVFKRNPMILRRF